MDYLRFEDYITIYGNMNSNEWTTLYENIKSTSNGIKHDIFSLCALVNDNEKFVKEYLNDFEWGFSPDSFGHSYFEHVSRNVGNGKFEDEIFFVPGYEREDFEYLVAYRSFNRKYAVQVEINPKLIWYNNLVKIGDNYIDPISDEVTIKTSENKIEVLTKYLKDFLCAYNKICVITFDHRRFALVDKKVNSAQKPLSNSTSYLLYSISTYDYSDYNVLASIIGKSIITPYKECHHSSLQYLIGEKEYNEFIYGTDTDTGNLIKYTCDENKLANYFGANPQAPHFLTPVFFNKSVLNKYKTDTANYVISDGHIRYLDEWILPFTVNEEDKVVVWLGDLGRIPFTEQKHWGTENIPPKGAIEENFWKQQMESVFVDKILPEKWLFTLIRTLNEQFIAKYSVIIFNPLSEADSSIYSAFVTPVVNTIDEYKEYLMQFCKITCESINTKAVQKFVQEEKLKDAQGQAFGSIGQLDVLFKELGINTGDNLISSLRLLYNSRNKLSGHTASLKAYNKLWKREESYLPNWIMDSKILLNSVNDSLNELIEELE
jgi:hypothetical protein